MSILSSLNDRKARGLKSFAILIDPDKTNEKTCKKLIETCQQYPPSYFLVGGSLILNDRLEALVTLLKAHTDIPVVLFPGSFNHITQLADGLLLLSLISGRNPDYLIGQHVQAAPLLMDSPLEVISTGYLLVDCGQQTTVSYISNTTPLPYNKADIALCTALAGEMIGMKCIYMDGGSGADRPIDPEMIKLVAKHISVPLIIGGGIRNQAAAKNAFDAGADLLVVGTAIEQDPGFIKDLYQLACSHK